MTDYTELIERLRKCEANCSIFDCENCAGNDCEAYDSIVFKVAADAIEELLADRDMFLKAMTDEHNRAANCCGRKIINHQWISVGERLPEQYKPVHVSYVGYNTNSLLSDMVAYRDGDGDWCWWDGVFPSGEICKVKITHWMPLPEPPKEDADNG